MNAAQCETLRKAIDNLVDAKLQDILIRPGGLDRLLAHLRSGVCAPYIRNAQKRLEQTLAEMFAEVEVAGGSGNND